MSDIKSLILPFFFVITFFSVSVITSFPVFVSVFVIAFYICFLFIHFCILNNLIIGYAMTKIEKSNNEDNYRMYY